MLSNGKGIIEQDLALIWFIAGKTRVSLCSALNLLFHLLLHLTVLLNMTVFFDGLFFIPASHFLF